MPENFNLNQLVLKVLKKNNINNLTDVQLETFNPIVEGQNILVNAHTGTGKTLSFLIPLYEKIIKNKQLKTLILAPSRELANQIYNESLMFDQEIESKSICIIGGVNQKQQIECLNQNWNNLICTPGRVIDLVKQKYINLKKISLFIIDESDMMLDFGFINDIYWINDKLLNKKQTLLFSATNNKISTKLSNIFNGQNYLSIDLKQGSKTNSDITNLLYFVSNKNKSSLLIDLINRKPGATYIIFMNMIKDINYVARELFKNRIAFEIISSEKSQRQREVSIEKFKNYQSNVLIATDVISRGIHIDNIDFIINYNVPKQLDTFIHRVGRTGRINFIANITPIELDGSIISKATLHNAEYILEKDIRINDVVEIYKAGDVIPKIIRPIQEERKANSVEWKPPLHCPCCRSALVKFENEVDQYCININCEDKIIQQISHFCSRDAMNVDGLSEAIIEKFYKNNLIKDIADLYEIKNKKEAILNLDLLIKEKAFNNIVNAIEKTKENSLEKLIFGLGIRHVGFNVAKLISKRFKSINGIINASVEDILAIGEVGEKIAISITNWFNDVDNIKTIKRLKDYGVNFEYINEYADIVVSKENEKYKNKSFVITGSFEKNRNEIKNILESVYHAKVTSSVTKNTDYLIIGNSPTLNKIEKAKSLNIPIIEKPFWND